MLEGKLGDLQKMLAQAGGGLRSSAGRRGESVKLSDDSAPDSSAPFIPLFHRKMLTLVGFDLRYELVESVPGLSARFGRHQRQDLSQHFEMVGFSSDGVDIHVLFFRLGESPHC